jgi:hypothetical protein
MTDALARWFLEQVEDGNRPWIALERLLRGAEETSVAWVEYLWGTRKLRKEDVALVAVYL